ncbi:MAG: hypothetical protein OXG90_00325 [Gammaproteobacteria bacterium]|nr:hypothetical protein [Gammaproteobacteria bacterium]
MIEDAPQGAFPFRRLPQWPCYRADSNVIHSIEPNRNVSSSFDFSQDNFHAVYFNRMETEVDFRLQQPQQPVFQRFVTLFRAMRVEAGSHERAGAVFHSPKQITIWLLVQRGGVGECRDVLADVFRIAEIPLELDPLGFAIRTAQGADEGGIILFGEWWFLYAVGRAR